LAASQTVANYWLPALIHRYQSRYPGIVPTLSIGNTEHVAALVHDGLANLGFVEGEIADPVLSIRAVAEDELVLVSPSGHRWARRHPVPTIELTKARWVLREPGSGTRSMFEAALIDFGLNLGDLDIALELPSNEAVRAAVEAGAGVTVISRLVAASSIEAGTLVVVDVAFPKRHFFSLRHKDYHVTHAAAEFIRLIEDESGRSEVMPKGAA
jgi:DNA-binding transcriptional LysR family regulator